MKIVGITSTGILSLLVAVATTVYAQHEPQGEKQDHSNHQGKQEQGALSRMLSSNSNRSRRGRIHRIPVSRSAGAISTNKPSISGRRCSNLSEKRNLTRDMPRHSTRSDGRITAVRSILSGGTMTTRNVKSAVGTADVTPLRSNSVSSTVPGSNIAHNTGSPITATGNNAVAIADTASLTTAIVNTLVRATDSASMACPSNWLAGTLAFGTRAIG